MSRRTPRDEYSLAARFGADTMAAGFTAVPNVVLERYAELGLTPTEMMTVIHLWYFWWKRQDPFPAIDSVAKMMGISRRQAQTYVSRLRDRGLINVRHRAQRTGPGRGLRTSSAYDFSPLIQRIKELAGLTAEQVEELEEAGLGELPDDAARNPSQRDGESEGRTGKNPSPPRRRILPSMGAQNSAQEGDVLEDANKDEDGSQTTNGLLTDRSLRINRSERDLTVSIARDAEGASAFAIAGLGSRQLWAAALEEVRSSAGGMALDQWLRATSLVGFDGDALLVSTASSYARDWLTDRASDVVARAVASLIGQRFAVRFVVDGRPEGTTEVERQ